MSHPDGRPATIERALLIVSPAARRGSAAAQAATAELSRRGISHRVLETKAPRHATELAAEHGDADEFDAVFAVGGDGTAMEVITAFAERPDSPPVGIIPAGTANVLARSLGIPMSATRAMRGLLDHDITRIDLGRTNDGRRFALGLGIGLDAAMIAGASTTMKRRLGYLAYALSGARAGLRLPTFGVRVTVDGRVHETTTSSLLVANFGTVLGGRICFGSGIRHDDGLLHVCLYSPRSRFDAARVLWRMLRGTVASDRCYSSFAGKSVRIEVDRALIAQADGELLGLTPIDITIEPGAARLLVPHAPILISQTVAA